MKTVKYKGLTFICGCKLLPPPGYSAITLFGYVLTRKSYENLIDYLNTESGQTWVNHESIHIMQADTFAYLKWFFFYLIYICQFLKAWPFSMSWDKAYKTTCFELEAYMNQSNKSYNSSKWWDYLKTNTARVLTYEKLFK